MFLHPFYLLLCSSCLLVGLSDGYVATIDCSGKMGEKTTKHTWECSYDGTVECAEVVTDCSGCGNEGGEYGGTITFSTNGQSQAVGGGWDCRGKCTYGKASYGEQEKWSSNYCS